MIFFANLKLNFSIENYIKTLEDKNYQVNYNSKKKFFLLYKNTITFHNFYIEDLNDINNKNQGENLNDLSRKNSNFKAKKLILNYGIFSILTGNIKSVDLIDSNINFYQATIKTIEDWRAIFQNLNGRLNIQNCDLYIYNNNNIVSKIINSISGSFEFINGKIKIATNFYETNDLFKMKVNIDHAIFNSEQYDTDIVISTNDENITYVGNLGFKEKKLNKIQGAIKANGVDLEKILKLFRFNEVKYNLNNREKFVLDAKINYENDLLKISEIKYQKDDIQTDGTINYAKSNNQLDINLSIESLKIFDSKINLNLFTIKDGGLIGGLNQLLGLSSYYNFIESFDHNLDLKIGKITISDHYTINDLNLVLSSGNKRTIIKKLNGKLNNQYNISMIGEILNNNIRNQLRMRILIPLDKKNEKIDVTINYIDRYITFSNINIINKDFIVSGKATLNLNDQINFISGDIDISNYNLSNLLKNMNHFLENKGNDKNGILTNILLLMSQAKINSDLKINFKNSILNGNTIDNLLFVIKNDEKRIKIINKLQDKKFFSLNNQYELHLNELRPKLTIQTNGDNLNIKNLLKIFLIKDNFLKNYFLFNDEELRKKTDKVIIKDINLDFKKFQDIDFSINGAIKNIIYNDITINEISCSLTTTTNIMKINNCYSKIEYGKIDLQGTFNFEDNSLNSSIKIDSINFNNFLETKREKPTFMSANGNFFSSGNTIPLFIKNSVGYFEYLAYNHHLNNLDLNLFINNSNALNNYSDLISLSERSVVSGETIFNDMKGSLNINNGILSTNFQFSSDRFTGAGIFNISNQTSIFKGLTRIAFIPINYQNVIYADLDWSGNLYNTNKAFNVENLKGLIRQ